MRTTTLFNSDWVFEKLGNKKKIDLPHTWNDVDGQDGGDDYYRGICTYTKSFENPLINGNDKAYIEFRGANSSAEVRINGNLCGIHEGGYSTFRVNITEFLKKGLNTVEVTVDNVANSHVYPQYADFTFYGGIYRNVYLITVPESHIELENFGSNGVKVTPLVEGTKATITVETHVVGSVDAVEVSVGDQIVKSTIENDLAIATLVLDNVHLWDGLDDPYLYEANIKLIKNDVVMDSLTQTFGCRTFDFDKDHGFILNGRSYPLHGVSRHQDRKGVGNAINEAMQDEDMDLILEMGANSIRLAHYQHDQYFYDLCDQKGIIVWAEIPYISGHMDDGDPNTTSQMKELVLQNYNHPSIICWALSNEITAMGVSEAVVENHKRLNDLVHSLDKTRVTVFANVFMLPTDHEMLDIPDILSYNLYYGWYLGELEDNATFFDEFHEKYPNRIVGLSEYGADATYFLQSLNPEKGDYSESYQSVYHEYMLDMFSTRPYLWSTYVWNMFDFGADGRDEAGDGGVNHKGLISFDRKIKKDAFYIYKAWWSKDPFVHLCGSRYVDRVEAVTKVKVYSNLSEVSLYKDGKLVETKTGSHVFEFEISIEGNHIFEARSGDHMDRITVKKVDEPNPTYFLKSSTVQNWFDDPDLAIVPGHYSVHDTMEDILKSPEAAQILGVLMSEMKKSRGELATRVELGPEIQKIMNRSTVVALAKQSGDSLTETMLKDLNQKLVKIRKV